MAARFGSFLMNSGTIPIVTGLWRFQGNGNDESGAGSNFTDVGGSPTYPDTGLFGKGAQHSTSTYQTYAGFTDFTGNDADYYSSISVWFKCNAEITTGIWPIVSRAISDPPNNINHAMWAEYQYNGGSQRIAFNNKGDDGTSVDYRNGALGTEWHHIFCRTMGDPRNWRYYFDGQFVAQRTNTGSTTFFGQSFRINADNTGATKGNFTFGEAVYMRGFQEYGGYPDTNDQRIYKLFAAGKGAFKPRVVGGLR